MSARLQRESFRMWLVCTSMAFATVTNAFEIDYDPRRPAALRSCDQHLYEGRTNPARTCYAQLLAESEDLLTKAEASWRKDDVASANELFRELIRAKPDAVHERIRWGQLFVQTHQYGEAVALFREALEIEPEDAYAKVGLARVYAERFEGAARPLLTEALQEDDALIGAHLLLARMSLEEGDYDQAQAVLSKTAKLTQQRRFPMLEVSALRAALELSRDRDPQSWLRSIREINPSYGVVYEQLAHFEIMRRRYREATQWLRQAVAAQPQLWSAHAELGLNLLRLGDLSEARKHLALAYSGDPYSPIIVNSLRLLDRIDEFELIRTEVDVQGKPVTVQLRMHRNESQVLQPYVTQLAADAIRTFSQRYRFTLSEPVTLELYPDHDDFAVRVAALPGIGLLGVTFGRVVAMDSPAGRSRGDFHWGSTLWHEIAHVFTLEATDHRVPRWLSEGISVYEEWRTGPTPGVALPPETIQALREDKMLPIEDLDAGFIRPSYPQQIQVSYMQAGLVCLFIEQRWGFDRIARLLEEFAEPTTTAKAIQAALEISPSAFDREFDAFVNERFAAPIGNFDAWQKALQTAHEAVKQQDWSAAIDSASQAVGHYPQHVGPGSAALVLGHALNKAGRRAEAIAALKAYRDAGGWEPDALLELARWLDEAGDQGAATEVFGAVNYVDPMNTDLHSRLGERLLTAGDAAAALREFRVLRAIEGADPATAHFGAARALRVLGNPDESRRELLDALAAAPHYRPAQALLLETIEERTRP
jgi:cellulose synthase operon protein C